MGGQIKKEPQKVKKVHFLRGDLQCHRCGREWTVADLNETRKVVPCPVCGEANDIREAMKRAA